MARLIRKSSRSPRIGGRIGGALPEGFSFALLIFDVGENAGGRMNYISKRQA
jgi:hypothetical protein